MREMEKSDPRQDLGAAEHRDLNEVRLPKVANKGGEVPTIAIGLVVAIGLGVVTFFMLTSDRGVPPEPTGVTAAVKPPPPAPPPAPIIVAPPPAAPPPPSPPVEPVKQPIRSDRLRAPALVIDYGDQTASAGTASTSSMDGLGINEAFAARLGQSSNPPVKATKIQFPSQVVPEGTIISGVLETAINSDLPGYVRAIVDQDVYSFDSSAVMVPRGSRLIGQYRSGLAIGESRAFVIWTRLLRPDGVSVNLASPATDTLGRAGLTGKVDRHFLQRFGSAILLSVIGGGLEALSSNDNEVVVGTANEARGVAETALAKSIDIPPTIKVKQGTAIRIFTARDLYFPSDEDFGQ